MKRGKYIVIEGPEGSGKTTQSKLILPWLNKYCKAKVINTHEPGGTPESEKIRTLLKELNLNQFSKLMLMNAARNDLFEKIVIPSLNKGEWVVSARDKLSSLIYQGYAGGVDYELVKKTCSYATKEVNPDLYIIIDVDVETGGKNEIEKDQLGGDFEFRNKVRKGYLQYARENPDNTVLISYDGSERGIEKMQEKIRQEILKRLIKD